MHRTTINPIKKEAHPKVIRTELVLTLPSRREGVNSFIADKYKYTFPMIRVSVDGPAIGEIMLGLYSIVQLIPPSFSSFKLIPSLVS